MIDVHLDGPVAILKLDRPAKRNALNTELVDALGAALAEVDRDSSVRVIVLGHTGEHFSAGADIEDLVEAAPDRFYLTDRLDQGRERLAQMRKPVIAAVSGLAVGGGFELLLMCDLIVANSDARFGCPEVRIGTLPGAGATQRLTRAVGYYAAADMILRGRLMPAADAGRAGLIAEIVEDDPMFIAKRIANDLAALPMTALMMAKEAMRSALETSLGEGLRLERRLFHASLAFPDLQEGAEAFLNKRPPIFNKSL